MEVDEGTLEVSSSSGCAQASHGPLCLPSPHPEGLQVEISQVRSSPGSLACSHRRQPDAGRAWRLLPGQHHLHPEHALRAQGQLQHVLLLSCCSYLAADTRKAHLSAGSGVEIPGSSIKHVHKASVCAGAIRGVLQPQTLILQRLPSLSK